MLEFSLSQNPGLLYYDIRSLIRSRKEEICQNLYLVTTNI